MPDISLFGDYRDEDQDHVAVRLQQMAAAKNEQARFSLSGGSGIVSREAVPMLSGGKSQPTLAGDEAMNIVLNRGKDGEESDEEYFRARAQPGETPFMTANRLFEERETRREEQKDQRKNEAERLSEQLRQAGIMNISPEGLRFRDMAPWHRDTRRAGHTIAMMDTPAEQLETYAWLENDIAKTISLVRDAALPPAAEVERYANETGISRYLVRDLLPHAKDELEAKAIARGLLDIYGGDIDAVDRSYVMRQIRNNADSFYWMNENANQKAKFEAALISRYGDFYATLGGGEEGSTAGRILDQLLFRGKNFGKRLVAETESTYHGFLSAGAKLVGDDRLANALDKQHEYTQSFWHSENLDTGNRVTDWLLDTALIDAPLLYTQMTPYVAFGSRLGGYVRHASMWGSELSSMTDQNVPLSAALPLSFLSSWGQRYIEQKHLYPRFERLTQGIRGTPMMQRPFGQYLYHGMADSLKQGPDEFLQESISKIANDLGYLATEGSTWDEFSRRAASGWDAPIEGAVKATVSSLFLLAAGTPNATKAHIQYRQKINTVDRVLNATAADAEAASNPDAFKNTAGRIIENAKRYNQDAPSEVYLSADQFDAIVPDKNERARLLSIMGAADEYSRSRATGADMSVKLEGYAAAIANHEKRADFQRFIKIDPDGPTLRDVEQSEEMERRIQAETDGIMDSMQRMAPEELPAELNALLDDLRQIKELTAEEINQLAAMYYSGAKVAAEDLGGTPGEWIDKMNLRVKFADQIRSEADIEALRRGMEDFSRQSDENADMAAEPEAPATVDVIDMADAVQAPSVDPAAGTYLGEHPSNDPVADRLVPSESREHNEATQPSAAESVDAAAANSEFGEMEREAARVHAARLDKQRITLGNLLVRGKHLARAELAEYGLSAWHPQSVRRRMIEMKAEAEQWRNLRGNPHLVARIRDEVGAPLRAVATARQDAVPNIERIMSASQKIGDLFDAVMSDPGDNRKYIDFMPIESGEAEFIKARTGLDIGDAKAHMIDASSVTHFIERHGEGKEFREGQVPLTRDDVLLIPWVIANPDTLEYAGKTRIGRDAIRYEKRINGNLIVIEELRTGRNKLAITTMWKMGDAGNPQHTSDTSPAPKAGAYDVAGSPDFTIPSKTGQIKPEPKNLSQAALVDADPKEWLAEAANTIAAETGMDRRALQAVADTAERIIKAGEDIPEARAVMDALGLGSGAESSGADARSEGRRTKVIFPAEAKMPPLPARYVLMELDRLQPSHLFRNYTPNPAWTAEELAQQRNYDSGAMEATRQNIEIDRLDFDTLFNPATDAVNGPPIITPDGKVLGGNNRSHRIYNRYDADGYRDALVAHLAGEDNLTGIRSDAAQRLRRPVLVRVVEGIEPSEVPALIGSLNADFTTRRDPGNLAANRGMRVGKNSLRAFAAMNDETIAAYLEHPDRARKVLQAMVEDGALQQTDLPGLYDFANSKWLGDGRTSGKAQIEQALFGAILPDSRLLDDMPDSMKKKLVRALPALLRLKRNDSPDLANLIQAMQWNAEFRDFRESAEAQGLKQPAQLELFRKPNQRNLFTGETAAEKSGPAWDMFQELLDMRTQKETAAYFTKKADELTSYGRGLFGSEQFGQAAVADAKDVRGDVTFHDGVTLIRLFRGKADFSSVLHEMGHVFLYSLEERVLDGTASDASMRAYETLRRQAGGEFTKEGVETVMRQWEAYLREGKAPSRPLIDAFGTFRSWLTGVYEDIRGYLRGEDLNDDVRSAFDHLLASEQEIREVREFYHATRERLESLDIYTPSDRQKIAAKRAEVEADELGRQDRLRIRAYLRAMESREPVNEQARADVAAIPVYRALDDLLKADGIDAADLEANYGRRVVEALRAKYGERLFGGEAETLQAVAGDHGFADGRALTDALLEAKSRAEAVRDRIREIMNERTDKAREWIALSEAVPGDEAYHAGKRLELMAMQLDGLRRILNETQQKRIQSLNLKAVTDAARSTVGRMLVRDLGRHRQYAMAERRLAREAMRAAREGDIQAAYDALEKQMFNHAITAAMFKAREGRERFARENTARKLTNALADMQEQYREPLRQTIARYGVAQRPTVRAGQNGEQVVEWTTPRQLQPLVGAQTLLLPEALRNGNEFEGEPDHLRDFLPDLRDHVPGWIVRLERPDNYRNWKDLTFAQMEQLADAIDLIVTHGKGELTALRTGRYQTIEQAVKGIVEVLLKSPERPAEYDRDERKGEGFNVLESFLLKGVTVDSIFAVAEGNPSLASKGELQRYVEAMREKEAKRDIRKKEIQDRLRPELEQLAREAERLDKQIRQNGGVIDGLPFHDSLRQARGKSAFTGEMIIAANLNTGTADSLFQLQTAYEWDDGAIDALRSQLSEKGWRAIEAIWREMDALFPEMSDVAFEATHIRPPKEAGKSFTAKTSDGSQFNSDGGYYPLAYDGMITQRQAAFQDLSNAKAMAAANNPHATNKPRSGFRNERKRGDEGQLVFKGAPLLRLSPIPTHFDDVVHFITHGKAVWELDRITGDPRFKKAFVSTNGMQKYKAVRLWVNYLANPTQGGDAKSRGGMMNFLHDRYITSVLGWNLYSANKQRLGYFTALSPMSEAVIDGNGTITALKYIAKSMWDFGIKGNIGLASAKFNEIKQLSDVMKSRDESGSMKEMRDRLRDITPLKSDLHIAGMRIPVRAFRENLYKLITICDRGTAGPLWHASYSMYMDGHVAKLDGLPDGEKQQRAIRFADSIAMTQTSPFQVDHSPLQRGEDTIAKFASVCISGVMQPGNGLYQSIAGAARGNVSPRRVASYIAKTYVAMSYTQILASMLYGLATGEDDPWPKWYEWILAPIDNMVSWIPYARNVVSVSKYGSSGKGVPSLEAAYKQVERVTWAAQKADKGEYGAAGWHGVQAFSYAAGIPLPAAAKIYRDMKSVFGMQDDSKKKKNGRRGTKRQAATKR